MAISKLTPILFVDRIEPCLSFWVDGLGFEKTVEVPGESGAVFVILQSAGMEVMYQTWASLEADESAGATQAALSKGQSFLYLEVGSLAATMAALGGVEVVMPVRTTFYGATEIGVREPGGHFVTFAQMNQSGN